LAKDRAITAIDCRNESGNDSILGLTFACEDRILKNTIYKSDAFAAIHASATALHKVGAIDKATVRDFDAASLSVAPEFSANEIQKLRKRNRVSQPVFARYLNTSEATIEKWESGVKRPSGMALKLLAIVQKHGLSVLS
jgi:putative transcriptional regulator